MNSTITPVPQPEIPGTVGPTGPQIPGQPPVPGTPYVNPNITSQTGSSFVQGVLSALKTLLPTLELLSDDEKRIVGEALMPPLSRIQDERITRSNWTKNRKSSKRKKENKTRETKKTKRRTRGKRTQRRIIKFLNSIKIQLFDIHHTMHLQNMRCNV